MPCHAPMLPCTPSSPRATRILMVSKKGPGATIPAADRAGSVVQVDRTAKPATRPPASGAAVAVIEVMAGSDRDIAVDRFARAAVKGKPSHVPGMPVARIRQRGRSPVQSGRARESNWLLTFEPQYRPEIDFLMGWTGSRDTRQQVQVEFSTLEEAVAFASRRGLSYVVEIARQSEVRPKSYADNLRQDRRVHRFELGDDRRDD